MAPSATAASTFHLGWLTAFAAVTDLTLTYLVDDYYDPADELGVAWDDLSIGADWGVAEPVLSARDLANPGLRGPRLMIFVRCSGSAEVRLLVTGGAGFIGANFVHRAVGRGDEVTVYDALTYAGNPGQSGWSGGASPGFALRPR